MDLCARLCRHYLSHDDVDDVSFMNGQAEFPQLEFVPGTTYHKNRRIIIYSEFSSMHPLLQNVLRLHGVPSLTINGQTTFDQRNRRIKDLHNENNKHRVLIFSSVGSAGLNLAIADVVIFFDQPWSAQDEQQIRGRAHRQPQTKNVKVIYLLANNSADPVLHSMARGKRDMFNAFVNNTLLEELQMLLQGLAPDVPDIEETPASGDIDASEQEGEEPKPKPKPKPQPKPKKTKKSRRQIVVDDDEPSKADAESAAGPSDGDGLSDGTAMSTTADPETQSVTMSEPEGSELSLHSSQLYGIQLPTLDIQSDHSAMDVGTQSAAESTHSQMNVDFDEPSESQGTQAIPSGSPSLKRQRQGSPGEPSDDYEDVDPELLAREREMVGMSQASTVNLTMDISSASPSSKTNAIPTKPPVDTRHPDRLGSEEQSMRVVQTPQLTQGRARPTPASRSTRPFLLPPAEGSDLSAKASQSSSIGSSSSVAILPGPAIHSLSPTTRANLTLDQGPTHGPPSDSSTKPSRTPGSLNDIPVPGKSALKAVRPTKRKN